MNLNSAVRQRAHQFEKLLNSKLYLFRINGSYIELPPPQASRKDGTCTLYIPEDGESLALADKLGTVRGSVTYQLTGGALDLKRYSFGFEHNHTYIQLHEETAGALSKYGFHYDMDKDNAQAITHPLHHLQLSMLDVPRFTMSFEDNEIVVFDRFLDLIKETFYTNNTRPPQKPKLECSNMYLSAYR